MYPSHPNQPWPGFKPHDAIRTGMTGQINPSIRSDINMQYGRQLAGLGRSEGHEGDSDYADKSLSTLESDDDVLGSGIFDAPGSQGTVHVTLGVFRDHPNIPGYIAREIPFKPSTEVESVPSGAQVIVVPGGGMTWGGRVIGGGTAESPGPQTFVGGGSRPVPTSSSMVPVGTWQQTADAAPMPSYQVGAPGAPRKRQGVFSDHRHASSAAEFRDVAGMAGFGGDSGAAHGRRREGVFAPRRHHVSAMTAPYATSGFGIDEAKPSVVPYLIGGAMLGAAAAIFKKFVLDKK